MSYFITGLLSVVPLLIAAWAHLLLARVVRSERELWISRWLLLGVGIAFGLAMAWFYFDVAGVERLFVFLGAFGITHVPAAAILFLKSRMPR